MPSNKSEKVSGGALKYAQIADIVGHGEFPVDMLRYDRCAPFEETDSHELAATLNPMVREPNQPFRIRVIRYWDTAKPAWSVSRWRAFHCEVYEASAYESRTDPLRSMPL